MTTAEVEPDHEPSRSQYVRGVCACVGCKAAHSAYQREWRARRKAAGLASWFASRGHVEKRPRGALPQATPTTRAGDDDQ